ncbi:lipoate--protein ligase family protein [Halobellus sp. EA9]|uniref:lipoate--protein ligase family protein n=1 Tax=Halobellus sp. EA9 TaxID=3421647 RepID=UPI003EBCA59A
MIERVRPDADRVRVIRGRAPTLDADRSVLDDVVARAVDSDAPALRVRTPHRQLAFGRRDARSDGYERAREVAERRGYPPIERAVGGRAVAYTGTTVAFAAVIPAEDPQQGLEDRYEAATAAVVRALRTIGAPARRGEPEASFCPGDYSVQGHGKIAGLAQRIGRDAARVSGIVVADSHAEIAAVLAEVYDALDVPFDPDSVGSVARSGGRAASETVIDAIVDAFCGSLARESVDVDSIRDRSTSRGVDEPNRRA